MLVQKTFTCERCGITDFDIIQSVTMHCKKCKKEQVICGSCVGKGCIHCGGKLLDEWQWSEYSTGNKVVF